jgi:hypothetical protein
MWRGARHAAAAHKELRGRCIRAGKGEGEGGQSSPDGGGPRGSCPAGSHRGLPRGGGDLLPARLRPGGDTLLLRRPPWPLRGGDRLRRGGDRSLVPAAGKASLKRMWLLLKALDSTRSMLHDLCPYLWRSAPCSCCGWESGGAGARRVPCCRASSCPGGSGHRLIGLFSSLCFCCGSCFCHPSGLPSPLRSRRLIRARQERVSRKS